MRVRAARDSNPEFKATRPCADPFPQRPEITKGTDGPAADPGQMVTLRTLHCKHESAEQMERPFGDQDAINSA